MPCLLSGRDRKTYNRADRDRLQGPRMGCVRCIQGWSGTAGTQGRRSENKLRRASWFPNRCPPFESIRGYVLLLLSDKTPRLRCRSDSDAAQEADFSEMAIEKG